MMNLVRELRGRQSAAGIQMKGADANGYIWRFIQLCNYALHGYYTCISYH